MPRLDVQFFGPVRFIADGEPWRLSAPPRCATLLAYLALRSEPVPRVLAASTLWPDELDSDARTNLRRYLHRLRGGLPASDVPWVVDDGTVIGCNPAAPLHVDVAAFETLVAAQSTRAEAVALYRGDLLEEYDDEWIIVERERLRALYLGALLELAAERRCERDFSASVSYAERLLAHDDLREDALRELIAARYESGDRGAALGTYERFALRLREALHVDPMPETVALADAIRAHAALGSDEPAEEAAPVEGWQPAFAGREVELQTLRRAWARAARGAGMTIFAGGEAGIGKSRLVGELAAVVRSQGGRVVIGMTSDPEGEPYQALLTALRRVVLFAAGADQDPQTLVALARVLPEVRAMRRDLPDDDAPAGEPARARLFEAIARFVERVARARPLLLVLEDLHWAGEGTIDALCALARRAGSLPLLLVVTYRTEEAGGDHPLRTARAALAAEHRASALALRRLDARGVAGMLACAEFVDAPAELGAALHRISDGNPLFAVHLARGYVETGRLPGDDATNGIGEAIARRIARLDPRVRAVGEVAAALGETFSVDAVRDVGGWDESWVLDAIGELMDAAMVREAGARDHAYAFTHALVGSALYASTPDSSRAARHRRIARVFERRTAGERPAIATIARHWRLAGDRARAAAAYTNAASAALKVYARTDAVAFARAAFELADDDAARFAALHVAATAQARSGDVVRWDADLAELEEIAARLGDARLFDALALRETFLWQTSRLPERRAVVDRMAAIAERLDAGVPRAIALQRRGAIELNAGRLHDALATFRAALALARPLKAPDLVFELRHDVVAVALRLGEYAEAAQLLDEQRANLVPGASIEARMGLLRAEASLAAARLDDVLAQRVGSEMLELARRVDDAESDARAHMLLAYAAAERGEPATARVHYEAVFASAVRLENTQLQTMVLLNRGLIERDIGRLDDAIALWDAALPLAEAAGLKVGVGYLLVGRSEAHALLGGIHAAQRDARAALAAGEETGERRLHAGALVALGAAQIAAGLHEDGVATLQAGIEEWRAAGVLRGLGNDLTQLLEAFLERTKIEEAREIAAELREFFESRAADLRFPARAALALANEARARGNADEERASLARGRELLAQRLRTLEGQDRAAYAALPFNRALESAAAATR